MYLKSIEMQGFKSFADKTKIEFDKGVTAVVGPNGSGKSNITESLRWALGESSAKSLRGGKMPDVIFAGTESRKALNYASVIVTLDNSTGFIAGRSKEIRVERHIYRSGDNDYLIDGQKVRLRDIHELFMDTGLGRDSFSIISQGRVEAIFNSKPEERRAIFEEAAGVLKYKHRKKETQDKLTQAQDNLDRLEDIIYELEHQVTPLEKQAQKAKEFLRLDEQRKDLYLNVLVAQIENGRQAIQEKEKTLQRVKADLESYYKQRERLETDNQELKYQRQQCQTQLENEQAVLLELTKLISDLEKKIQIYQLESSQKENSRQEARLRLSELGTKLSKTQDSLANKRHHLHELEERLAQIQTEIAATEKEWDGFSENPDQVLDLKREQYVQLLQDEAEVSNALAKVEQDIANQRRLSDNQSEELTRLEVEKRQAQSNLELLETELAEAKAKVQTLLDDYHSKKEELEKQENEYHHQQTALFDLLDQLKTKKARQASLEAILQNHSNYYAGVKAVLQQSSRIGGIIGAVSAHLTFDMRFQTALEIALGGASQHVIVEDEATAKVAIAFLKQQRQGRATFLPLTTIKPRQLSGHLLSDLQGSIGFLGLANELVTYDKRLSPIFQNILGNIAIFDTVEHANQAARKTRFQVRLITLDGTDIRPGGSFSGGSTRTHQTVFVKPELDALTDEITALQQVVQEQEKKVQSKKEAIDGLQHSLEEVKKIGEEARLFEQGIRFSHEQSVKKVAELTELYTIQEEQSGMGVLSDLQELACRYQEELAGFSEQKRYLTNQIDEMKHNRYAIQEQMQALQETLSDLKVSQSQLMSEVRFEQTDCNRLESEQEQIAQEMTVLQAVIEQKGEIQDEYNLQTLTEQLKESEQKQAETKQYLLRLKLEMEDIEGQFEDITSRLEQLRLKNDELIRHQATLEAEYQQTANQLKTLLASLSEQYKMSFEAAVQQAKTIEQLSLAEQTLKDLERSIRALGPINLDAINQYEEVYQRLTFLNSQREDILSARNLLLDTIHEMDDEVKERFTHTFEAIRDSFQRTFKQMFGGGSADLLLTSSDMLTAGIDISVQPPGKKIQSLNLMSGGEKALSALALLFSIIRVKTIPFVILDEVEAALDEANVKRFGDFLNRFDKSSQFIVVTHRKGTMAAADVMYGVTMQESGVSKIVSVKLKDIEQFEEKT